MRHTLRTDMLMHDYVFLKEYPTREEKRSF